MKLAKLWWRRARLNLSINIPRVVKVTTDAVGNEQARLRQRLIGRSRLMSAQQLRYSF